MCPQRCRVWALCSCTRAAGPFSTQRPEGTASLAAFLSCVTVLFMAIQQHTETTIFFFCLHRERITLLQSSHTQSHVKHTPEAHVMHHAQRNSIGRNRVAVLSLISHTCDWQSEHSPHREAHSIRQAAASRSGVGGLAM